MALSNPTAADHIASQNGAFEPQRSNNFTVEIALGQGDRDIVTMSVHAMTLPKQSNEVVSIPFQNEQRKVAGQVSVDEGSITLRDYVDVDARGAIMRWRQQVYDPQTGAIGLAKDYKRRCYLILHAPDGTTKRIAKLIGCWPTADPDTTAAYDSSDSVMLELSIACDKVTWDESLSL